MSEQTCPTCGPTAGEQHPRRPVTRCANCKEWLHHNDQNQTTILVHSFDRSTGMCRCGEGPFVAPEWVAHYKAQDEPTRTTYTELDRAYDAATLDASKAISGWGTLPTPPTTDRAADGRDGGAR